MAKQLISSYVKEELRRKGFTSLMMRHTSLICVSTLKQKAWCQCMVSDNHGSLEVEQCLCYQVKLKYPVMLIYTDIIIDT